MSGLRLDLGWWMSWQRSCCVRFFVRRETFPRKKWSEAFVYLVRPGEPWLLLYSSGPDTADKLFQVNEVTITTLGT